MKVVFLVGVPPHKIGDIANVSEGYARNFLFPRKFALLATPKVVSQAQQHAAGQVRATAHSDARLAEALARLNGTVVPLVANVAPSGKLYAALNPTKIAEKLNAHLAITLPSGLVQQLPTLKRVGEYPVTLQNGTQKVIFTLKV